MAGQVRWGLLSTAAIGKVVVDATRSSARARFTAVASRDGSRAKEFASSRGLELSFGSYDELLRSAEVDAVYIPLPVSMHTEWTLKALASGKHVLCEKPFATTAVDAARCFDAASAAGLHCIEGLMYRHHPQTLLARRLLASGAIGSLATVRAALTVSVGPGDIRRSSALGGGALLDLGCYCVSAIQLFAGPPERGYAEQLLDAGVDLRMSATLRMPSGVLGQFDIGLDLPRRDELELIGTDGTIVVHEPWTCGNGFVELARDGTVERPAVDPEGVFALTGAEADVYRIELDTASAVITGDHQPSFGREDAITLARTLELLKRSANTAAPVSLA